ncbi:MAG: radical SAM protein [Pseudomonadota bacterium]
MRIALIYPPPWKIPLAGEKPDSSGEGPPAQIVTEKILSGDILNIPYGLLSLAAQTKKAGHDVTVLNLFTFPWQEIIKIIEKKPADLYGLSCFTSNRRGVMSLARLIRKMHPRAHIAAGGPHATAFPEELLTFNEAIDTIVIGEGEATLNELIQSLEQRKRTAGIAGTACRENGGVKIGPPRGRIDDLDCLVSPCTYFNEYILITSRGCPWNCTFCSSAAIWGKKLSTHSSAYVLTMLEKIVHGHGQKTVAIKDETFTWNRNHVLDICRGILKRNLDFLWSCDTRADALDEEMLFMMRKAGCRRISFGVESGSSRILTNLNKKISLDAVGKATALAKHFGLQVRFYMIAGSPGETLGTLQQSMDFIDSVKPCEVIFNPFTLFPGTQEFAVAEKKGLVSREVFFTEDFFELTPLLFEHDNPAAAKIVSWVQHNAGLQTIYRYSVQEQMEILKLFPELSSSYLDLGDAWYREGNHEEAGQCVQQALEGGFPLPGLAYNYFACIASRKRDLRGALENLMHAHKHGFHRVVEKNIDSARAWIKAGGFATGRVLLLEADNSFEVTRPKMQPTTPGILLRKGAWT